MLRYSRICIIFPRFQGVRIQDLHHLSKEFRRGCATGSASCIGSAPYVQGISTGLCYMICIVHRICIICPRSFHGAVLQDLNDLCRVSAVCTGCGHVCAKVCKLIRALIWYDLCDRHTFPRDCLYDMQDLYISPTPPICTV